MIKDYTTTKKAIVSVAEITGELHGHGARKILQEFNDNGSIRSISFSINTPNGEQHFRLPANVDGVLHRLEKDNAPKQYRTKDQAEKTAWRILYDWVRAQMAILEAEMVSMDEVFLPYLITGNDQTLFERYKQSQLSLTEGK